MGPADDAQPGFSEFLLRACHDLRTSLRAVYSNAELLQKDVDTLHAPSFRQRLDFILEGARGIDLLTEGLTAYSIALQTDPSSFQLIRMDVILRNALARVDRELRQHHGEVTSGELPRIFGNPDRLSQIFEILLRNALRHGAQPAPRIHITAEPRADAWLFAVQDNGPGIDAAWLERIFKPFERLRGKESQGVGLGLSICRAIVERHGGKLWAESAPGTGSTFLFTLPLADK